MKRTLQLAVLMTAGLFSAVTASAQTLKEFFNSSSVPLTYLGIDYSKAKLINDPGANTSDIKNRLYNSINEVVVNEPKNYDIAGAFHKDNVSSDLSAVKAKNDKINSGSITSSNTADFNSMTESDVASAVRGLNLNKSGIGLVFVMEGMKKEEKKSYGSVWVVLVDMKSKKVLMAERMEAEAAGFGFRNFWASIIKKTLNSIEKKKYKDWKGKYGA